MVVVIGHSLLELRVLIALVQQDVFPFDGSVRENIACGRQDASIADIRDAARPVPVREGLRG